MADALIDVDERTIRLGVAAGLMRLAPDGIHELTEKGEAWLSEWCVKKIEEAKS